MVWLFGLSEERAMRAEEFKELLRIRPFRPLRVHMTDGSYYDIRHPDQVLVLWQRVDIGVPADHVSGIMERVEHCSLLHVVRVEHLQAARTDGTSPEANGA
jgi:hypothetical protein